MVEYCEVIKNSSMEKKVCCERIFIDIDAHNMLNFKTVCIA